MQHVMTPRRRAALRRAQLASARKRKGRRRKVIRAAGAAGAIGVGVAASYAGYKGVKSKRTKDFRHAVRSSMLHDPVRQHHHVHLHVEHGRRRGRKYYHLTPKQTETLKAQVIFTNKLSQQRVAKRRAMTSKQRRQSVMSSKYRTKRRK